MINELTVNYQKKTIELNVEIYTGENTHVFSDAAARKEIFDRLSDTVDRAIKRFIKKEAKRE